MSPPHASGVRAYDELTRRAGALRGDRGARMQRFVDDAWELLAATGVSWLGFYLGTPGAAEMLLGPRRDKPACSPIGLHGACGRSFTTGRTLVVVDVAALGENYVACDPRDRSELVIPCCDDSGAPWGVLDLDSFDVGSFSTADAEALRAALQAAGLTTGADIPIDVIER